MTKHNLHMDWQGGFTLGKRTTDNLFILNAVQDGAMCKHKRKSLYCLFLNVAKAYDSIDRTCLNSLLKRYCFFDTLTRAIMSSLDNTEYAVILHGQVSAYFLTTRELKQGDSLSPPLFNLYIHDLQNNIMPPNDLDDCIPTLGGSK